MKRTPDIDVDKDFEAYLPITKAYVDERTGQRHIIGVASGVLEDRDGERVSKNGVRGMVSDVRAGGVKLTSSHQQDWWSEIGDVVKGEHDPETGEFIVDSVLPPEGTDPMADKAWRTANKEKVGFSVGGKLLKSFYEKTNLGKKRKVLDAIQLRHIALTKSPAYPGSFAEAVAKTWDGEPPADDAFTLEVEEDVEKADTTGSWASGSSDSGGGNTGRDSVGSGQRNAGERKQGQKGMDTEDDGSSEDQDLPKAKNERHLACPNCGHEFAADLPLDGEERQADADNDNDDEEDGQATGKSAEINDMSKALTDTLDALRALADADVAKTEEPKEPKVTKTATDSDDIAKIVAASHKATSDRVDNLEKTLGDAFDLIGKTLKRLDERIADMPQGRKSQAVIQRPAVGHEVEKTSDAADVQKRIDETDDPIEALKISNAAHWGVTPDNPHLPRIAA